LLLPRQGVAQGILESLQDDMERLKNEIDGDLTALKEDARE
jgi:hypothetical protein